MYSKQGMLQAEAVNLLTFWHAWFSPGLATSWSGTVICNSACLYMCVLVLSSSSAHRQDGPHVYYTQMIVWIRNEYTCQFFFAHLGFSQHPYHLFQIWRPSRIFEKIAIYLHLDHLEGWFLMFCNLQECTVLSSTIQYCTVMLCTVLYKHFCQLLINNSYRDGSNMKSA